MLTALIAGVTLGLSVALPFGPVSLVCVQRSIAAGYRQGLAVGAGAASAQGIYAVAALAGRSVISAELAMSAGPLRLASAAMLVWLGLRTVRRRATSGTAAPPARAHVAYGSSLALALSNPMTVLPYLAVASAAGPIGAGEEMFSFWSVPGVIAGAAAWYGVLAAGASLLRAGMPGQVGRQLNLVSGSMLMVVGLWIALR